MIGRRTSMILVAMLAASTAAAQVKTVDPNTAGSMAASGPLQEHGQGTPVPPNHVDEPSSVPTPVREDAPAPEQPAGTHPLPAASPAEIQARDAAKGGTYEQGDVVGAAEGVFGKGSRGLAMMIEDILRKQGEPNGYIVGREGGGALIVGLRYGSGTLHHKVEGDRPVYWTGPSIGFDAGANAGNAFVLVYNLYDTQDLYHRFGAGEGQAYLVGGFNVSYLRRGNVVLVPVRMGAGLRLGINAGYMKFSTKQNWLPF